MGPVNAEPRRQEPEAVSRESRGLPLLQARVDSTMNYSRRCKADALTLAMANLSTRVFATRAHDDVAKPIQPALFSRIAAIARRLVRETSGSAGGVPPTPEGDSKKVLDVEKLQTLDDVLPGDKTNAFVELYLTDADAQLAAIADAAKRADLNAIARSAHVLVSTAGNVGATAVSLGARRLMEACRADDRASVETGIAELQVAHRAASDALRAWLAARSAETPAVERA
jgi:HPt (histidine-containing phosphotransfer) domain-containing protein